MWRIKSDIDGREYAISPQGVTIGREGCDVPIPDDDRQASRRHSIVRLRGEVVEVADCGSTNGTFLGEVPVVTPMPWRQGIVLRCGGTTFQLLGSGSPARAPHASAMQPRELDADMMARAEKPESYRPPVRSGAPPPPAQPRVPFASPNLAPVDLEPLDLEPTPRPRRAAPAKASRPGANLSLLVIGCMLFGLSLLWWQYFNSRITVIEFLIHKGVDTSILAELTTDLQHLMLYALGALFGIGIGGLLFLSGVHHLIDITLRKIRA